jgi:hypothetical protein
VAVTAPAVFRFTAASNPDRHLAAAEAFGVDIAKVRRKHQNPLLRDCALHQHVNVRRPESKVLQPQWRHLAAAEAFGVDIANVKRESAGEVLGEAISEFLADQG